jgi:hypothetical protein
VNKERQLVLHETNQVWNLMNMCLVMPMSVSVCEKQSVDQVMEDHLTCEDEEKQEEEEKEEVGELLIENTVSLFDALQGLKEAIRYIHQFDVEVNILVMCSKLKTSSTH